MTISGKANAADLDCHFDMQYSHATGTDRPLNLLVVWPNRGTKATFVAPGSHKDADVVIDKPTGIASFVTTYRGVNAHFLTVYPDGGAVYTLHTNLRHFDKNKVKTDKPDGTTGTWIAGVGKCEVLT